MVWRRNRQPERMWRIRNHEDVCEQLFYRWSSLLQFLVLHESAICWPHLYYGGYLLLIPSESTGLSPSITSNGPKHFRTETSGRTFLFSFSLMTKWEHGTRGWGRRGCSSCLGLRGQEPESELSMTVEVWDLFSFCSEPEDESCRVRVLRRVLLTLQESWRSTWWNSRWVWLPDPSEPRWLWVVVSAEMFPLVCLCLRENRNEEAETLWILVRPSDSRLNCCSSSPLQDVQRLQFTSRCAPEQNQQNLWCFLCFCLEKGCQKISLWEMIQDSSWSGLRVGSGEILFISCIWVQLSSSKVVVSSSKLQVFIITIIRCLVLLTGGAAECFPQNLFCLMVAAPHNFQ